MPNFNEKTNFIWKIAELLRGPYKPEKYGDVILPMAVLRRFDCLLASTKEAVLEKAKTTDIEKLLNKVAGQGFSNKSEYDFKKLLDDPDNIRTNFESYIQGFSANIRGIVENFEFDKEIKKLAENNLLFLVIKEFNNTNLHPEVVSNAEMGYIFEELIRRFSENAEAGDHYTPREVIKLMVNLIFTGEDEDRVEELALKQKRRLITKKELAALEKLHTGKTLQEKIINVLKANISDQLVKNREVFDKKLKNILKDLKLNNGLYKAVLMGLSERDETADYCMKGGKKEADTTLRDTESIPLSVPVDEFTVDTGQHIEKEKQNILDYVDKEVKPHVKEFWIDWSKTKIGYEIPLTRYFYKYEELKPFKEIMLEIGELEQEIQAEMKELVG